MDLSVLNKICFTICIVCIVIGVVLATSMIWSSGESAFMAKGLATTAVIFFGAGATLVVSKSYGGTKSDPPNPPPVRRSH